MPFGGRLLRQNMGIEGVVGALNRCQEFMALVCENPLEVVG